MIQAWLIRQIPWMIIILAVIGSAWAVGAWLKEQGREEMRPVIERLQSELKSEQEARKRNEAAINGYLAELETIRNRPRPTTPVRLCVPAPRPEPEVSSTSTDDTTSTTGFSLGETGTDFVAGPDIGPALRDLALGCDAENAKLRALQNWVKDLVK